MRILIVILLFVSASVSAQFTSVVNGQTVTLSPTDSAALSIEWKTNAFKAFSDSIDRAQLTTLQSQLKTIAQTTVGVRVDQLTATQVRALFAIILFKESAIDTSLKIKPLNTWIRQ